MPWCFFHATLSGAVVVRRRTLAGSVLKASGPFTKGGFRPTWEVGGRHDNKLVPVLHGLAKSLFSVQVPTGHALCWQFVLQGSAPSCDARPRRHTKPAPHGSSSRGVACMALEVSSSWPHSFQGRAARRNRSPGCIRLIRFPARFPPASATLAC